MHHANICAEALQIIASRHALPLLPRAAVDKLQQHGLAVKQHCTVNKSVGYRWVTGNSKQAVQVHTKQMGRLKRGPAAYAGRGAYRIIGHHSLVVEGGKPSLPPPCCRRRIVQRCKAGQCGSHAAPQASTAWASQAPQLPRRFQAATPQAAPAAAGHGASRRRRAQEQMGQPPLEHGAECASEHDAGCAAEHDSGPAASEHKAGPAASEHDAGAGHAAQVLGVEARVTLHAHAAGTRHLQDACRGRARTVCDDQAFRH